MTRRDFIKQSAILAAGAAALPGQIAAFEQLFDVNSRHLGNASDVIRLNDIFLGGTARVSSVVIVEFYDDQRLLHALAFNAFGGMIRLVNAPDTPMFSTRTRFNWRARSGYGSLVDTDDVRGTVMYTDSDLLIHTERIVVGGVGTADASGHRRLTDAAL